MRYPRLRLIALLVGVWLLSGAPVFAQTDCAVNCSVSVGQPFTAFTEALPSGTNYALAVDGVMTGLAGRLVNGLIEFDHPGFTTKSTHVLEIRVLANGQWIALTEPLSLSVSKRPMHIRK
jgi:hypothetical protein